MKKDNNIVQWERETVKDIMYKYVQSGPSKLSYGDEIHVKDGEVAIFVHEGRFADAVESGNHIMNTTSLPILSEIKMQKKDKNFEADIYFIDVNLSKGHFWGSSTPVCVNDKNINDVSVGVIGKYDYQISDYNVFVERMAPKFDTFSRTDIDKYIKPRILTEFINAVNELHVSVFDIEEYYLAIASIMEEKLSEIFSDLGLTLTNIVIDEVHLPKFLKDALKKNKYGELISESFIKTDFDPSLGIHVVETNNELSANHKNIERTYGEIDLGTVDVEIDKSISATFTDNSEKTNNKIEGFVLNDDIDNNSFKLTEINESIHKESNINLYESNDDIECDKVEFFVLNDSEIDDNCFKLSNDKEIENNIKNGDSTSKNEVNTDEFVLKDRNHLTDNENQVITEKQKIKYEQFDLEVEKKDAIRRYNDKLKAENLKNSNTNVWAEDGIEVGHINYGSFTVNNAAEKLVISLDPLKGDSRIKDESTEIKISLDPLEEDDTELKINKNISDDEVDSILENDEDLILLDTSNDEPLDFEKLEELRTSLDFELENLIKFNENESDNDKDDKESNLDTNDGKFNFMTENSVEAVLNGENLGKHPISKENTQSEKDSDFSFGGMYDIDENLYSIEPPESETYINDSVRNLISKGNELNLFKEKNEPQQKDSSVDYVVQGDSMEKSEQTCQTRPYLDLVEERQLNNSARLLDASMTSAFIVKRRREEQDKEDANKKFIEELENKSSQSESLTNGAYNPGVSKYEYDFSRNANISRTDQRKKLREQMMDKLAGSSCTSNVFVHSVNGIENRIESAIAKSTSRPAGKMCPHCASFIPEVSKYCMICGKSTKVHKRTCSNCKGHVSSTAKYCSTCGAKV